MTNANDPIGRHLEARAQEIHLPRTAVEAIADRAAARTARRRKVTFGVTAVALLGAGSLAVIAATGDDGRTPVATSPDAIVDTPLDWTIVDPTVGLGGSLGETAIGDDGSLYSLSTQPGPVDLDVAGFEAHAPRTLYRSTDGADWETLTLPDQLYATGVAASGSRLYAVGTGPTADDTVPVRLSTSDDDGATWTDPIELPTLAAVEAFPGEISTGIPRVAVLGDTTVVAVTATAIIDWSQRLPAQFADRGFAIGIDGIDVYGDPVGCEDGARIDAAGRAAGRDPMPPSTMANGAGDPTNPAGMLCGAPPIIASLTWDQLDVPAELTALTTPQLHLFTATGDGPFAEVPSPLANVGYEPELLATDDGFTLVAANSQPFNPAVPPSAPSATVLTSPDGTTWTETAAFADFALEGAGVVDDQVMVAGQKAGQLVVETLGPDGVTNATVPDDAIEASEAGAGAGWNGNFYGAGSFGPLGWSVVLFDTEGEDPDTQVVHSDATGTVLSAVPVPEDLNAWGHPVGVVVTPDAIIVRFEQSDGNPGTPNAQRLFVGTPRG